MINRRILVIAKAAMIFYPEKQKYCTHHEDHPGCPDPRKPWGTPTKRHQSPNWREKQLLPPLYMGH
jgi:hypothetical protein